MCQLRIQNNIKMLEQAKLEKKLKDEQAALTDPDSPDYNPEAA
jgi:hypothetical protein